jgi:acetyl-CoA acetyltransferase
MSGQSLVVGVGMVPFTKPSASADYDVMGSAAAELALNDAGLSYSAVQQAYASYVYGDSTCGQSALYKVGLTGIPIVNVNNNCSSGSTALFLARQAVESGSADCVIAVGFEQMRPGALDIAFSDRKPVCEKLWEATLAIQGFDKEAVPAAQQFGGAGREYAEKYGTSPETFARISVKARQHAARNPMAIFRDAVTVEEVLASKPIFGPLTRLQCCPPTCGAAAAIIASPRFAAQHGLKGIRIAAQAMTTDTATSFDHKSMQNVIGADMARRAVDSVYEAAGVGPDDVDVVELHDCFTANELISYETLRLTPEGTAERFIMDGENSYGGRVVTNPSGGLLSKGHPLGATGLAQCAELVWQMRGQAAARQVEGARFALQHNLGLGGACVVTLYTNN